jgi:hypothetical protein
MEYSRREAKTNAVQITLKARVRAGVPTATGYPGLPQGRLHRMWDAVGERRNAYWNPRHNNLVTDSIGLLIWS